MLRRLTVVASCLAMAALVAAMPAVASTVPSGERHHGQVTIEPAYDDISGNLIYLATPDKSPFPTHTNWHSVAPLYLVVYPASATDLGPFNCAGVPGNCPDHAGLFANMATALFPAVYGTDPLLVPGHDHLVAGPASGGDFNVAWQVIPVLFTGNGPVTHITTEAALEAAKDAGIVEEEAPVVTFHCSVVSATPYWLGTPVGS